MSLSESFRYYWTDIADPRTKDWLLIHSSYQVLLIISAYLYFVLRCGPRFMRDRQPYHLKTFIKVYNIFQIVANAYLVKEQLLSFGWLKDVPLTCVPITYSYEPRYYKMAVILWWILIMKIVDCIETVVFILRKKNKQVSALHVYHHVSTVILLFLGTKYYASEMPTFVTMINGIVHVCMYTYYFLAAFGPRVQAIIAPGKRYITILQMVQFFGMIIYGMQIFLPSCKVPNFLAYVFLGDVAINWYMFYKFYQSSYSKKIKQ